MDFAYNLLVVKYDVAVTNGCFEDSNLLTSVLVYIVGAVNITTKCVVSILADISLYQPIQ